MKSNDLGNDLMLKIENMDKSWIVVASASGKGRQPDSGRLTLSKPKISLATFGLFHFLQKKTLLNHWKAFFAPFQQGDVTT